MRIGLGILACVGYNHGPRGRSPLTTPSAYQEITMPLRAPRRAGFTLIELLVVISIIALLVGILLPVLSSARTQARLLVCMSNVDSITTALATYAADNKQVMPRVNNQAPNAGAGNDVNSGDANALFNDPFEAGAPQNDIPAGLFLLLRQDYVTTSETFVSPSMENHTPDTYISGSARDQTTFSNVGSNVVDDSNLSYGYTNPYAGYSVFDNSGLDAYVLSPDRQNGDLVIIADRGPACCNPPFDNIPSPFNRSNIHGRSGNETGQHIGYMDGAAEFVVEPRSRSDEGLFPANNTIFARNNEDIVVLPLLIE